jgi:putative ABC transport system permease protein
MTDFDFIDTYSMNLVAGRAFSKKYLTDTTGTLVLNEAAIARFGWNHDEAIGKELTYFMQTTGKIVGVVKDFNFRSLHNKVEPLALILNRDYFRAISVRFYPGDVKKQVNYVNNMWEDTFPGELFEFSFLEDRMNLLYSNDIKMKNIFIIFSAFSVIVASLGLFGLSVFIASERTKEIGIRKALGATVGKVLLLFSKEFIIWIVIANIIAWPLAWIMMKTWLQNFAYKVEIGIWIFIISASTAMLIAIVTISYQSIKAAIANPIKALRYE